MCPIMLQCLKKVIRVGQIVIYKVFQIWAKLDIDHPFTLKRDFFEKLTNMNFVYFMLPIIILQFLQKESLKWIRKHKAT